MDGTLALIWGFVGTLAALTVTKTVERLYAARLQRAEMSRDLLLYLSDTLPAIERFIAPLSASAAVTTPSELRALASSFTWGPLVQKPETVLAAFQGPEVHRLIYLFLDREELFRSCSDEHKEAYYWLLDRTTEWATDAALERLGMLAESRERMRRYVREMLHFGYELAGRLLPMVNDPLGDIVRGDGRSFYALLERDHGLTEQGAKLRSAYYRPAYSLPRGVVAFDPAALYGRCVVHGTAGDRAILEVALPDGQRARLSVLIDEPFALPEASRIASVELPSRTPAPLSLVVPANWRRPGDLVIRVE